MIEYSTHNVSPDNEDSFQKIKECFGWQLVSENEVYSENTYISDIKATSYGDGFVGGFMSGFTGSDGKIEVNTRTDVTNYIHMRFARDTDMPGYDTLRTNEDLFMSYSAVDYPDKPFKSTIICVIATLIIVMAVVLAIINGTAAAPWEIAVCVIVPIVSAIIMAVMWTRYKKRTELYYYSMDKAKSLLQEARDIVGV